VAWKWVDGGSSEYLGGAWEAVGRCLTESRTQDVQTMGLQRYVYEALPPKSRE
jgi:hypothetical protein